MERELGNVSIKDFIHAFAVYIKQVIIRSMIVFNGNVTLDLINKKYIFVTLFL
jgi:hypothetical protein